MSGEGDPELPTELEARGKSEPRWYSTLREGCFHVASAACGIGVFVGLSQGRWATLGYALLAVLPFGFVALALLAVVKIWRRR